MAQFPDKPKSPGREHQQTVSKKPYFSPKLFAYGSIEKLTRSGAFSGGEGQAMMMANPPG